jgi:uncharacterized repeat protein (TIGR03803 family)
LWGGANGGGTVFQLTPTGTLTTLYNFCSPPNCSDGSGPGGLIHATNGKLYGTTVAGGAGKRGTVFKMTPQGTLKTVYSFHGPDGSGPGGLIQATDGNFYGTTSWGGANNAGTVFQLTPTGTLTTLYNFCPQGYCPAGAGPGGLIQATDGNLYGTTYWDGAGYGTVFQITPGGTLTVLYTFNYTEGFGGTPLVQATDGNFYGSTGENVNQGVDGMIFSLSMRLGPFVKTLPSSGKVGRVVVILGNNLTGATSVTFNGTPATFTVCSTGTSIKTTVPSGATTGKVQATTPNGTLTSNVDFRVTP